MRFREWWGVPGLVALGLLALPAYKADELRERVVGDHAVHPNAVLALLLLALAAATVSLLRRDHVQAHPARLTWGDDADRARSLRRGLVRAWALRFGPVAYLLLAAGQVLGWSAAWLPVAVALFAATGAFAFAMARGPALGAVELVAPFLLACLGAGLVGPGWLWPVAAVLAVAALALLLRPPALPRRDELVRGYWSRVLRSVSVAFGDVLALLPPARRTPGLRLAGRARPARFVALGMAARRGALPSAALLALSVPVLTQVLPVVPAVWWAGAGAYLAVLPLAGGLAELRRVAGLRRWLPDSDAAVWPAAAVLLTAAAVLWLALATLCGLPPRFAAAPLVGAAVLRTATRPDLDYAPGGAVEVGGVYAAPNLLRQLVRGPALLVVGLAALS